MGLVQSAQIGFCGFGFIKIIGKTGGAAGPRHICHVQRAALTGNDRRKALVPDFLLCKRITRLCPLGFIQQFDMAAEHIQRIARLNGTGIGAVDPDQSACGIAQPARIGQGIQQGALHAQFAQGPRMALAQARQLQPVTGNIADAQNSPAGNRPALGFEMSALHRLQGHAKSLAAAAQTVHRIVHVLRLIWRKPGAKSQNTARDRQFADQRNIALNIRLA